MPVAAALSSSPATVVLWMNVSVRFTMHTAEVQRTLLHVVIQLQVRQLGSAGGIRLIDAALSGTGDAINSAWPILLLPHDWY